MHSKTAIDVLGIGASIVDHIIYVSEEYLSSITSKKGGMEIIDYETFVKLLSDSPPTSKLIPGGSSANTIRGLAHLGQQCAMSGKIGTDAIGEKFMESLKALDVHFYYSKTHTPTGQVISFVTPDGERTCRAFLGACQEITLDDLDPEYFQNVKLVHIEGYTLSYPGLTQRAMEYAKNAGAKISLDLANFEIVNAFKDQLKDLITHYVDICFANDEEIKALTGLSFEEGCSQLKEICSIAVVHSGSKGCCVGVDTKVVHFPTIPIEQPLDTTAAGDLFASGFLHGYLENKTIEECAYYGSLIGTSTVQVLGSDLSENQWDDIREQILSPF